METLVIFMLFVLLIAVLTIVYVMYLYQRIVRLPTGTRKMQEIASAIRDGAIAFLKRQYEILTVFVIVVAILMVFTLDDKSTFDNEGVGTAIAFVVGSMSSVLSGVIGMRTATKANVRTTEAARTSGLSSALRVAFSSGSIMGFSVVALGLMGFALLFLFFIPIFGFSTEFAVKTIAGFGLGASSIALFARVGGGIYTKAADVGADLVGKVEQGIPEDDPRNPAVIADNVGDNVGDVAGMGADLYESYVGSIVAAISIGYLVHGINGIMLPIGIAVVGVLASLCGALYVKMPRKEGYDIATFLKYGLIVTTLITMVLAYSITKIIMPFDYINIYFATLVGIVIGAVIGIITDYYTSAAHKPTQNLSLASTKGAATTIIQGLSLGYMSTILPVLLICLGIFLSTKYAGVFGVAMAAVGMLSTLGYSLSTDAYAPVADNSGGIAEMSKLPKRVRNITDKLDAAGNTTAAVGKGFAIGSAALTALALFSAYMAAAGITVINLATPTVVIGLFIGGLLPFVFAALTMNAVGKAAMLIVEEVRRQFKQIKGLLSGKGRADYAKCVTIATNASLKSMLLPGIIAILAPILVGVTIGKEAVGGVLAGSLLVGTFLAISMANSGGAWDNAKKYIESGKYGGKGSDAHKASVVGDTVGDPFKDTSGPSMNILIKLMSIVALVFVVLFI